MRYIKDSPHQLADIRYIVNGEEREQKAIPCQVKTFDEAKELMEGNIPEAELSYFHILTEQELLERQSEDCNKSLRDPPVRALICQGIAEAIKVIGSYEKEFLEQLLAAEQTDGENAMQTAKLDSELSLMGYSDWKIHLEAIQTAIQILPFLDEHRKRISEVCVDIKNRRKTLEALTN